MSLNMSLKVFSGESLFYLKTYEENKSDFIKIAGKNIYQNWALKNDLELTTDLALYNNKSENLIVVSSGLHGIEGFAGSSLQRNLMQTLNKTKDLKVDVMLIHALNPWGMKNNRRVDKQNIDLNRNFAYDQTLYQTKNEDYLKISSFLNPNEKIKLHTLQKLNFFFESIHLIFQYGLDSLRKSILRGQYTEKNGLYFGGNTTSDLQNNIDNLIQNTFIKYKKIIWIDLHTGYGEKNRLHILSNNSNSEAGEKISKLFKNKSVDFGDQKKFYKANGDLCDYLNSKSTVAHEMIALVFEYGTMDSQKTLGSIESLRRMVIENQGFHHGYDDTDSKNETEKLFRDMFFPQDPEWRNSVHQQTDALIYPLLGL